MFSRPSFAALALAAACSAGALAQPAPAAKPAAAAQEPRSATPEPRVRRTIIEDEGARISELRVRGAVQSITVQPKGPIKAEYEVLTPDAGRDLSAGPHPSKGGAGKRVWRVWSF